MSADFRAQKGNSIVPIRGRSAEQQGLNDTRPPLMLSSGKTPSQPTRQAIIAARYLFFAPLLKHTRECHCILNSANDVTFQAFRSEVLLSLVSQLHLASCLAKRLFF